MKNDPSKSLSFDPSVLDYAIEHLTEAMVERDQPVPKITASDLPKDLPQNGIGNRATLDQLAPALLNQAAQLHHKGYFAHMDPPTPDIAWAAALWQCATNQNTLHPDVAPAARQLERRVIEWLAPLFGMQSGHMVSGATIANFTSLWVARDLKNITRVVASDRAHLSLRKSAHLLGLDYESIDSDAHHRIKLDKLRAIDSAAVVLTAGTVATGAVDPLSAMSELVLKNAAWCHVDAAWAGSLRFSDQYRDALAGIELADSVGVSAHKWLYQPKGAAIVLFKDYTRALEPLSYGGGYLAEPNIGLTGSAPATALPLAATLLALGRTGVAASIEADMERALTFAELIDTDDRFELWRTPQTGVVVFRAIAQESRELRARLTDAWVSVVDIDGDVWLRAVAANPRADVHHVYNQLVAALA